MKDGKNVILCIDDDADFLESVKTIIETEDYIVKTAGSAEEGLVAYNEDKADLIIVDLMMEEVDAGTSFVKEIRALGDTPPIYMLSSVGDALSISADYSALGLSGVFQKPIEPSLLLSTLKSKLNN